MISPLPAPLQLTEQDTVMDLPHLTWSDAWRPTLERYCQLVPAMGPAQRINYNRPESDERLPERDQDTVALSLEDAFHTLHVPPSLIVDPGVRRDMMLFAESLYDFELPVEQATMLTGLILTPGRDELQHLLAFLRAALAELSGQHLASHFTTTARSGEKDKATEFPPHADMWHTEHLFNVFNRVQAPGQGDSLLISMKDAWPVILEAGVPQWAVDEMLAVLAKAGPCSDFAPFNKWLYDDDFPWVASVTRHLIDACQPIAMKPGQGYFVNDRFWLHGRTELNWPAGWGIDRREHRLYRVGFNNRRLMREAAASGLDWEIAGTEAAGCLAPI